MGSQIPGRRNQRVRRRRLTWPALILPERRFECLNRMKVAIFADQALPQDADERRCISTRCRVASDEFARRIDFLLVVA